MPGYNPYRDARGRFAPGPSQKKVTALRNQHGRALAASVRLRDQMMDLKARAKTATPKQRAALKAQFDKMAKRRAELQGKAADLKAKTAAAAMAHKEARAKFERERGRQPAAGSQKRTRPEDRSPSPRSDLPDPADVRALAGADSRRMVVAMARPVERHGGDPMLHDRQLSPDAQRAVRDHHNAILKQYGLHDRDAGLVHASTVEVGSPQGMGFAAAGLHWAHDGRVRLDVERAQGLVEHSSLNAAGLHDLGQRATRGQSDARRSIDSYRVATHEAIHGHGPDIIRVGHFTMLEEMSTEMVARRVTADVHGVPLREVHGSYGTYIDSTVRELSRLSRRQGAETMEALAHASVEFKRKSGRQLSPSDELHALGSSALRRLGVTDPHLHLQLHSSLDHIAASN